MTQMIEELKAEIFTIRNRVKENEKKIRELSKPIKEVILKDSRSIIKLTNKINKLKLDRYYVYACFIKGELKYIGHGNKERYKHCTSGYSSCKELNDYYFKYGTENIIILTVQDNMYKKDAMFFENALIDYVGIDKLYNIRSMPLCDADSHYGLYAEYYLSLSCSDYYEENIEIAQHWKFFVGCHDYIQSVIEEGYI